MTDAVWTLWLPFADGSHPSLNDRGHWAPRAKKIRDWRDTACLLACAARVPALARVRVELHYTPAVKRRRDEDNLVAALKPLCDGLVDARVVPDDTAEFMERVFPTLGAAEPGSPSHYRLTLTALERAS